MTAKPIVYITQHLDYSFILLFTLVPVVLAYFGECSYATLGKRNLFTKTGQKVF